MKKKIAIIGGGLWGGLLAWAFQKHSPETEFILFESQDKLGGNHTWCFHESDIGALSMPLLTPFIRKSWPGYEVAFPSFKRTIDIPYHAISSVIFDSTLRKIIPEARIRTSTFITVQEALEEAEIVFDCRGLQPIENCGYQKFVGLEVQTKSPHGILHPVLMDATVPQLDGFRFIYLLPFDERTLLIEDTRYSSNSELDIQKFHQDIAHYMTDKNWVISNKLREEAGILPIPFHYHGTVEKHSSVIDLRGIFHDTTGYSLPDAVRLIQRIVNGQLDPETIQKKVSSYRRETQSNREFFCFLNRMMFQASEDEDRYKTLEFFYRSHENAIKKFYAGKMNGWDKVRFFLGKPPVKVTRALQTIMRSGL